MATEKKRLPKELQTFKREMKKATFEEKVKRYFDLSPVLDKYSGAKKVIIMGLFTTMEKGDFYTRYYPIRLAIEENEEKVRKFTSVLEATNNLVNSLLRIGTIYSYFGEGLTEILRQEETNKGGQNTKEIISRLKCFRSVTPGFYFEYNARGKKYSFKSYEFIDEIRRQIGIEKRAIALLKGYYNALREFLDLVEQPQLFPAEFKRDEELLILRYHNYHTESKTAWDDKLNEVATEAVSLDYHEIEAEDYSGSGNPWLVSYNSI